MPHETANRSMGTAVLQLCPKFSARWAPFTPHKVLEASWKAGPIDERTLGRAMLRSVSPSRTQPTENQIGADQFFDRAPERCKHLVLECRSPERHSCPR